MEPYIKKTDLDDINFVAENIRVEDLREVEAYGRTPRQSMMMASCDLMYTIMNPEIPVGIFGLYRHGYIWMLATPRIQEIKTTFLRASRPFFAALDEELPLMFTYSDDRNEEHHRWLKWNYFSPIGKIFVSGHPFTHFIRNPPDV